MKNFDSLKDYFRFALAREFVHRENCQSFSYKENFLEKIGGFTVKPLFHPSDYVLKNIRNPLFISATVIVGLALTTLVFYPALVPGLLTLTGALKFTGYLLTQSTIVGLGLRTLGRLHNDQLMTAWKHQLLLPINLGTEIIRI